MAQLFLNEEEQARLGHSMGPKIDDLADMGLPLHVALVGSGVVSMRALALVGCGKQKLITLEKVMARDLYVGRLFRAAFDHALRTADDVLILSALHALVEPTNRLSPYDFTMTQMLISEQIAWGRAVVHALKAHYPLTPLRITFYAGQQYIRPVMRAVGDSPAGELNYWSFEDPLKGLDLFERLAWFKEQHAVSQ